MDVSQIGDPSIGIKDLEDIRAELIAISGVPATYLGYQDATEVRDKLVNLNVVFATEISAIQGVVNEQITNLLSRISQILNFKKDEDLPKYVKISLTPPIVLMLQLIESTLASISDIQKLFAEMPNIVSSPEYLLNKFVPYINWEEFFQESLKFKQKLELSQPTQPENGSGMMGGGSSGGY